MNTEYIKMPGLIAVLSDPYRTTCSYLPYDAFVEIYDASLVDGKSDDEAGHIFIRSDEPLALKQDDGSAWLAVTMGLEEDDDCLDDVELSIPADEDGDYYVMVHGAGNWGFSKWYKTLEEAMQDFDRIKTEGFDYKDWEKRGFESLY